MLNPFKPDPKDPKKVKRNFAIGSFLTIVGIVVNILYIVRTGDTNTAANLTAASGILIVLLPTLMAPVTHYFYLTGKEDENKEDK